MGGSFYSYLAGGGMMGGLPDKRRVEQLLDEQYTRVKTLLAVHSDTVHSIAQALIQQGELLGDDIQRIIDEKDRERQSQDTTLREDTRRLAYHEAGHAIAQAMLLRRQEVGRVSIVSTTEPQNFNELRPLTEPCSGQLRQRPQAGARSGPVRHRVHEPFRFTVRLRT
ncbi:MAG: hypothetical protein EBT22_00315 [Chloroflexi bacterium]|nr:hypothetical protein [Chloroflexota bacterium]